tara:strand:+ start:19 stop:471 length:453 start_codon:yes stop_codon:yes gene_type:complete
MTQVDFYHLTLSDLETTLVQLLKKTMAAGKSALILCPKPAATGLDAALWTIEAESWIPHGVDDAEGVDVAPVWISTDPASNPIDAPFLFLVHGQTPPTLEGFERVFNLFDGRSEAQKTDARAQWKEWLENSSLQLGYYTQAEDGGWQKNA